MKRALLAGVMVLLFAACGGPASTESDDLNVKSAAFGNWGVDLPPSEAALNPGDDFHGYMNAAWFAANPVPPERSSWGSFSLIAEQSELRVRAIITGFRQSGAGARHAGSKGQRLHEKLDGCRPVRSKRLDGCSA